MDIGIQSDILGLKGQRVNQIQLDEQEQQLLWLQPDTDLRGWQVDGQSLQFERGDSGNSRSLTGFAMPAGGVELTLDMGPGDDWPELLLAGVHNGLPDDLPVLPRRPDHIRRPNSYSDSMVAVRHVAIDDLLRGMQTIAR